MLSLTGSDAERFSSLFSDDDFYVPPLEALRLEAGRERNGHFNVIHRDTALRADVYLLGSDPLHAWGFEHRTSLSIGEHPLSIAPIEYVILRKLEYFRDSGSDRHLRDVAMMLQISDEIIDHEELRSWIARLELEGAFDAAVAYDE